jgi:hypothetical protein
MRRLFAVIIISNTGSIAAGSKFPPAAAIKPVSNATASDGVELLHATAALALARRRA